MRMVCSGRPQMRARQLMVGSMRRPHQVAAARRGRGGLRRAAAGQLRLLLSPPSPRFVRRADLVGEEPDVERTGRLVFLDILTVELVALYEVALRAAEPAVPLQADHHRLRHDLAPKLTCTTSTHVCPLISASTAWRPHNHSL